MLDYRLVTRGSESGQNLPLTMDGRPPTTVADGWTAGYAHVVQLRLKLWQERRNVTVQRPSIAIVIWFYCCLLSLELSSVVFSGVSLITLRLATPVVWDPKRLVQ